jgi:hypothetical protein
MDKGQQFPAQCDTCEKHKLEHFHMIDAHETLMRGMKYKFRTAHPEMLETGAHAARNNHPEVAAEYSDRTANALQRNLDALRGSSVNAGSEEVACSDCATRVQDKQEQAKRYRESIATVSDELENTHLPKLREATEHASAGRGQEAAIHMEDVARGLRATGSASGESR